MISVLFYPSYCCPVLKASCCLGKLAFVFSEAIPLRTPFVEYQDSTFCMSALCQCKYLSAAFSFLAVRKGTPILYLDSATQTNDPTPHLFLASLFRDCPCRKQLIIPITLLIL